MNSTPVICFILCAISVGCAAKDSVDETPNDAQLEDSTAGSDSNGDDVETGDQAGDDPGLGDNDGSTDTGMVPHDTGNSEVDDGDVSVTPPDSISEAVCLADDGEERVSITLANSTSEASLASFTLEETNRLLLTMPDTGDGFLQVDVPDWMSEVRIFTEQETTYEILGGEEGADRLLNGSCPEDGITDHLWYFHEWGSYTIRFVDDGPDEPWLSVYKL